MTAYHITTDKTGAKVSRICRARPGRCPLGGTHFDTKEGADREAERQMSEQAGSGAVATVRRQQKGSAETPGTWVTSPQDRPLRHGIFTGEFPTTVGAQVELRHEDGRIQHGHVVLGEPDYRGRTFPQMVDDTTGRPIPNYLPSPPFTVTAMPDTREAHAEMRWMEERRTALALSEAEDRHKHHMEDLLNENLPARSRRLSISQGTTGQRGTTYNVFGANSDGSKSFCISVTHNVTEGDTFCFRDGDSRKFSVAADAMEKMSKRGLFRKQHELGRLAAAARDSDRAAEHELNKVREDAATTPGRG